jgi:putative transposase
MINREYPLPLTTQCKILNLSRSGVYYIPVLVSDKDRELMNLIDRIHLDEPYLGTRGIRNALWDRGHKVGRSRTLMRKMGIEALYQASRPLEAPPGPYDLPLPSERGGDYGGEQSVGG